MIMIVLV